MRKTKIICTLGPSTDKDGVLEELVKEGMNVARFNFSHGLHDEQKGRIDKLKEIRTRLNKPVAALLDTKGPEIRIREFENGKVTLKEGQEFTLTTEEIVGNEKIVSVTYKDLDKDPTFSKQVNDDTLTTYDVVVKTAKRAYVVKSSDLFTSQSDSTTGTQQVYSQVGDALAGGLSNANSDTLTLAAFPDSTCCSRPLGMIM